MRLPAFELERFFARHEFTAPHLLCASDCESLTLAELVAFEPDAAATLDRLWLGYTESSGHPELREAIAGLYERIDANRVLVHSGAEEAIFGFMNVALEPGDHVVVHAPCYQSLMEVARAIGCEVSPWNAREDYGWALYLEDLERLIRPDTRAVVVNFPHNPTGFLPPRAVFDRLVEIVRRHGLLLFSDEVYRLLEYDAGERLPAACDVYENAVSLGVMSKSFGLAGLRIGWIATRDERLLRAMAGFKDYTTICNAAPSELLAALALRHRDRVVGRNLAIVRDNLARLDDFFARRAGIVSWRRPKAGSVAFPRLEAGRAAAALCADLIEKKGVLLAPARAFGHGDCHFRLGFGRKTMPEALARFDEYLDEAL
ncbi:MAG: aminotransferase class I/II-fold pyridoxal phosphate-dependent enzyme [Alphaproteobacteria bacterium]